MKLMEKIKLTIAKLFGKECGVDYINGSDNLPPPLSKEEESAAFLKIQNCLDEDESARNLLIEHNLRLVVYIAKKFENSGFLVEDLISIGTVGLIKAVSNFSLDKNIKFATFASKCVENEILMYLRKTSGYRNEVSIDEPLNVDWDGNELQIADVLGTDNDIVSRGVENESERQAVIKTVNALNERDRTIIQLRFGFGTDKEMTQKDVAELLGISQSYISRLEKKIIKKLRQDLELLI